MIVGGLLFRVAGRLRPVAVRLRVAPCPHCWRCQRKLAFNAIEFVLSGDLEHPWVACCAGCVTDSDREARESAGAEL